MKTMILAAALLGVATAASAATPDTVTWRAELIPSKDGGAACGADPSFTYAKFTIVIDGVHLVVTADPQYRATYPLRRGNLTNLKADGSGTLTSLNRKGQPWDFLFDAGHGARKIKYGPRYGMCRFEIVPITE